MDCSGDLRDIPVMPVILSYRSEMNEADEPESSNHVLENNCHRTNELASRRS